jgi:hypothetical protein
VATFSCFRFTPRLRKKKKRFCESLRETETEVTVVDDNEVEGSDKENEQEEQTEPVNVVEQTDEEDSGQVLSVRTNICQSE